LFFLRIKRDVGVQAIEQLLEKRRNQFDYILLETTGVADPLPIVKMFWLDDELHSDLILDGNQEKFFEFKRSDLFVQA
jgi:G3E family GTPase